MYRRDTIAAIATAAGAAGIGVVRVSGSDVGHVVGRVFRGFPAAGPEPRRLYRGEVVAADGTKLDEGLAVVMPAPASYTGEDVLELHCHGGALLLRRVLEATLTAGARVAEPGEFTLRAFLNGKLDLAQAESVADLVAARSTGAMRAALDQLGGQLSRAVEFLRRRAVGIAAEIEVSIDFSEEDVPTFDAERLTHEAARLAAELRALASTHRQGRILRDGLRVAIVGKPNVGKSSLLNRLLGEERSIVTTVAGTTRDVIEEAVDVDGIALVIADTAGIRESRDEVETIGIERSRARLAEADVALVVLDASQPLDSEDRSVLDASRHKPRVVILNKSDLPSARADRETDILAAGAAVVETSMLTGAGIDRLRGIILDVAGAGQLEQGDLVITRERHRAALEAAAESLDLAAASLRSGKSPDLVAVDVMRGLEQLGEIVGATSAEAILDHIFSEFCIGK